jgi:hypothetical protein
VTETVVLAVCLATYSGESVALDDALESFTLRSTNDIYERNAFTENVRDRKGVAKFELSCEVCLELDKLALRSGSCLFEVPLKRRAGVLFCSFVIGKLYSGITIFFYCTELRNNARTSLDNGAWNILSLGTENGSHSDFLSN